MYRILLVLVSIMDIAAKTKKSEKGKFHICSKSIIFEPNNPKVSIYKYLFKEMTQDPKIVPSTAAQDPDSPTLNTNRNKSGNASNEEFNFAVKRILEIDTNGPPAPYIIHDFNNYEITIVPAYENIGKLVEKIHKLMTLLRKKNDTTEAINKIILEDSKLKFDMSHLESITEKPLLKTQIMARKVFPLISHHGVFYITNKNIYFQTMHSVSAKPVKTIHLSDITKIFKRRFELRQIGLEVYTNKKSHYFVFENNAERDEIHRILIDALGKEFEAERRLDQITEKWQREEISNYDYLIYLNEAADRTFTDITQYPVFPWIITDYESTTLDLNDKNIYRDLTKPIGALNTDRLNHLLQRMEHMPEPRFLYGTHYSASGYVINYLLRKHPQYMLKFQSGKFDKPDRLFWSVAKDWNNVINNYAVVKELIPEFYGSDEGFLVNNMKLDLGFRQNGKRVNDVKLPKWAKKDPKEFLKINRAALESKYVSDNLQHWIDLIFGYKQRGEAAQASHNLFHYLTYEGAVDLDAISDPLERNALTLQINEFGQTPRQLFKAPHPSRYDLKAKLLVNPKKIKMKSQEFDTNDGTEYKEMEGIEEAKSESNKESGPSFGHLPNDTPTAENDHNIWLGTGLDKLEIRQVHKVHKNEISGIMHLSDDKILTTGHDGFVKITQAKDLSVSRSFKVCDLSISSIAELKQNELYALGSWDNNVYIFNLNYGTRVCSESLHNDAISQVVYDPNKSMFFTGSWDCSVRSWGYKGGQIDTSTEDLLAEMNSQVSKITVSANGDMLLFGDIEGNINLIDLRAHQTVASYAIENERITALKFLNDNQILATGETCVKLLDLSGKEYIRMPIDPNLGAIVDAEVEGANFVIATDRGNASVYNILQERRLGAFFYKDGMDENEIVQEYEFMCLKITNEGRGGIFGSRAGSLTVVNYSE